MEALCATLAQRDRYQVTYTLFIRTETETKVDILIFLCFEREMFLSTFLSSDLSSDVVVVFVSANSLYCCSAV